MTFAGPNSERQPFPVIMRGKALHEVAIELAKSKQTVLPIQIGMNTLELRSFLTAVQKMKHLKGQIVYMLDGSAQTPFSLDNNEIDILVFTHDQIPLTFQEQYAEHRYQHIRAVVPILKGDITGHRKKWSPAFFPGSWRTFTWPSWHERSEDQTALIEAMYERISPRDRYPMPKLEESAVSFLRHEDFQGTDQVRMSLNNAVHQYFKAERKTGRLTDVFFTPHAERSPRSSRRGIVLATSGRSD